jgi:hypothetical protein
VEPGEGALDDPAVAAEAGAVRRVASCDLGRDAALAELAAMSGIVVGAVGGDRVGRRRGRPTLPRTGGTRSTSGISCVLSWRLPPVSRQASGIPPASTRRWCLEPFLARSTGLRARRESVREKEEQDDEADYDQRVVNECKNRATNEGRPVLLSHNWHHPVATD